MNWNEYFYYDETSPSCLRWKVKRKAAEKDSVAGWDDQCSGYYRVQVCRRQYFVHRIIWELFNGSIEGQSVDHIDNDRKNNRISNLQLVSTKQNNQKRLKRSDRECTSKFKGVSWIKRDSKWGAAIKVNGKALNLGSYFSEEEAARAYDENALKYFGEFALLNFRQ